VNNVSLFPIIDVNHSGYMPLSSYAPNMKPYDSI